VIFAAIGLNPVQLLTLNCLIPGADSDRVYTIRIQKTHNNVSKPERENVTTPDLWWNVFPMDNLASKPLPSAAQFDHPPPHRQPATEVTNDRCALSSSVLPPILTFNLTAHDSITAVFADRPLTPPQIVVVPPTASRQPISSGIMIPPLPTYPPPELPIAAEKAGINVPVAPCSAVELLHGHTLTDAFSTPFCSSPSTKQTSVSRQSVLDKNPSAPAVGTCHDDGMAPSMRTSVASTEGHGEDCELEDIYGDQHESRSRLRMVSSLGALSLNGTVASRGKTFFRKVVGRRSSSTLASST
jgi:hypothetical protein